MPTPNPSQLDICKRVESAIRRNGIPIHIRAMSPFDHNRARLPPAKFLSALRKYVRAYHGHSRLIDTSTSSNSQHPLTKLQVRMRLLMSDPKWQRPAPKLHFSRNILTIVLGHFLTAGLGASLGSPKDVRVDWDLQVKAVRTAIKVAREKGAGIILDLRKHNGGNFQPVVDMFQDVFKNTTLFAWCNDPPSPSSRKWLTQDPTITNMWMPSQATYIGCLSDGRFISGEFAYPCKIAVIIGSGTASSGEIAAAMFVGKTGVRLFGQKTAGALSVNQGIAIAPTLELNLTELLVATTDKVMHLDERLRPDSVTKRPLQDARAWLRRD